MSYDSYIENLIETRRLMNNMVGLINYQERNMRIVLNNSSNSRNSRNSGNSRNSRNSGNSGNSRNVIWDRNNNDDANDNMFYTNSPFIFSRNPQFQTPIENHNRHRQSSINVTPIYNHPRSNNRGISRNNSRPNTPTQNQITRATNNTIYSNIENPSNTICPISRDLFNDDDNITQIIPCGHIFSRNNLREWFTRNSGCPMCRYDIRNYNPNENYGVSQTPNNSRQTTISDNNFNMNDINLNDIAEQIADDILNNVPDSSNNISLEYSLFSPYNNTTLVPIFNRNTTRRTMDTSLNIL